MSKRNIKLYLDDIRESVKRIEEYTKGLSFGDFAKDKMRIDATVRNFEILGEAARNIPKEFKTKYPEISWKEIVGIRNRFIHEYFGVSLEIV